MQVRLLEKRKVYTCIYFLCFLTLIRMAVFVQVSAQLHKS